MFCHRIPSTMKYRVMNNPKFKRFRAISTVAPNITVCHPPRRISFATGYEYSRCINRCQILPGFYFPRQVGENQNDRCMKCLARKSRTRFSRSFTNKKELREVHP